MPSELPRTIVQLTPELRDQIDELAVQHRMTFNHACEAHLTSMIKLAHMREGTIGRIREAANEDAGRWSRRVELRLDSDVDDLVRRASRHYGMPRSAFIRGCLAAMTEILLEPSAATA